VSALLQVVALVSFEHQRLAFNPLDTPRHQNFSEDTIGSG
jgi:peptide subunit release factor RF-3